MTAKRLREDEQDTRNSRTVALLLNPALGAALLLVGLAVVLVSAYASHASGNGEWFQRSGSVFVLISVVVEIQQTLAQQPTPSPSHFSHGARVMTQPSISAVSKWLRWIARAGIVIGTGIWGYGDLVF